MDNDDIIRIHKAEQFQTAAGETSRYLFTLLTSLMEAGFPYEDAMAMVTQAFLEIVSPIDA